MRQRLLHWQQDADLAAVRDKDSLDKLPDERQQWRELWNDVDRLLRQGKELDAKDELVMRQVNEAVALLRMNQTAKVLPLLKDNPDPRVRRYLIERIGLQALADYAADQPQVLAELLLDADDKQFAIFFAKLKDHGEQGLPLLTGEIDKKLPPGSEGAAKEKLAKRQVNAAVALHRMNQPAKVFRDFLVSSLEISSRKILEDTEKRILKEFAAQPELLAELEAAIETAYTKMPGNRPYAMILEARGTVQLQSTRIPKQQALPRTLLYTGDSLGLGADAKVEILILSDLHKERLRAGKEVRILRKGCQPADAVLERDQDILMPFVHLGTVLY